jgi:hypothetical protein
VREVGERVTHGTDPKRSFFCEAPVRVTPPHAVAGIAVTAFSIVRAILEVLLSLLFAL